ncbi:hypothetical protein SAMN04487851_11463 [Prevotella sp. tc2-28]|nr:hypothetical protein SAMN04487851_11463 [Prevotella sp. tc2-28]
MEKSFETAKYHNKWVVFDKVSRTFTDIGKGRKFCEKRVLELNSITKN